MSELDYDDCQRMRDLCKQLNELTISYNDAIESRVHNQLTLDNYLMKNYDKIPENYTLKKQIIRLCTFVPEATIAYNNLELAKRDMKMLRNRIKNIEAEVNVIKKTYDSTPK